MRRSARATALPAAIALVILAAANVGSAHPVMAKPIRWLFAKPAVTALARDPTASALLTHSRPFVMWGRPFDGVPPAWDAVPVIAFRSFGAIKDALASGGIGPRVKGVMYDYERWPFTPDDEQRNPAPYVKRAAELVHARGLLFLTAPAVNIVTVMAPARSRERMDESYLQMRVAAVAAQFADVVDIQAQRYERDAGLYGRFVQAAAMQARQANPKVIVLAGLSTEPIGQRVSADEILDAIRATRASVDGYWFNIPEPSAYSPRAREFRPDIAIEVLRRLSKE